MNRILAKLLEDDPDEAGDETTRVESKLRTLCSSLASDDQPQAQIKSTTDREIETEAEVPLEDVGTITQVGRVPVIDNKHYIKLSLQTNFDTFRVGQRVRYSYTLRGPVRMNIIVLPDIEETAPTVNNEPFEPTVEAKERVAEISNVKADVSEPKQLDPPSTATTSSNENDIEVDVTSDDPDRKQRKGTVKNCHKQEQSYIINVSCENGQETVLEVGASILSYETPMENDRIVIECYTKVEEEIEQLDTILRILPENSQSGVGVITDLQDDYGVIDDSVLFARLLDNQKAWTLGDSLEYECIASAGQYKWRCLSAQITDALQKAGKFNFHEFLDVPENYNDRNGIAIENRKEISFQFNTVGLTADKIVKLTNRGSTTYRVVSVFFFSPKGRPQIRTKNHWRPINLPPKSEVDIRIQARSISLSNHEENMIIMLSHNMCMVCKIPFIVGTKDIIQTIAQHEQRYKKISNQEIRNRENLIDRSKPVDVFRVGTSAPRFIKNRIEKPNIPHKIWELMCADNVDMVAALEEEYPFLGEPLNADNYVERFRLMVFISEAHLKKCFKVYDLQNVQFEKEEDLFMLPLANLAESRPSVLVEDKIVASSGNSIYTGIIKKIKTDRVLFEFNVKMDETYNVNRFNVHFHYNRGPIAKQLHAIKEAMERLGKDIFFPDQISVKPPIQDVRLDEDDDMYLLYTRESKEVERVPWFNTDLNIVQKNVVINSIRGDCRPFPYVISGPPGTGKTSTLVELIMQVYTTNYNAHILVCAPSNSAANLILQKLLDTQKILSHNLIRIIGFQVMESESIPDELLRYCGTVQKATDRTEGYERITLENGFRQNCQMEYLCDFRIIVVTIGSVGTFMEMGFPEDHFTHLFVDEAGQCVESEMVIPMSLVARDNGHMVFIGDEKQLGPIVPFIPLQNWSYDISLFERLQQFPLYDRQNSDCDPRLSRQLVYNYRSIPSILKFYNTQFYNDTLEAKVVNETDPEFECLREVQPLIPPSRFRKNNCGVFFYPIKTQCTQNRFNPSWINPGEIKAVTAFYRKLLSRGISDADVGIISPYLEQVRNIRVAIESDGMVVPKIGTVEEFQGQERMIILISTVRSLNKNSANDQRFTLGFIAKPKRINVAISRARALLVFFGNPLMLERDPIWRKIILQCQGNGAFIENDTIVSS